MIMQKIWHWLRHHQPAPVEEPECTCRPFEVESLLNREREQAQRVDALEQLAGMLKDRLDDTH